MENIINIKESNLLDQDWKVHALSTFKNKLMEDQFPCLFGIKSVALDSFLPVFCDATDEEFNNLLYSLIEYTNFVKSTDVKERIFMPLIVFFDELFLENNYEDQRDLAWAALNLLHAKDLMKWPDNIPIDPDDVNWSYCFNEVQLFFNMNFQNHVQLKSRNLGKNLVFIINPRENFDFVAQGDKGMKIRRRIRERISVYNDGHVPKELGAYGDGSKEWEQYQLEEDNFKRPKKCPFKFIPKGG